MKYIFSGFICTLFFASISFGQPSENSLKLSEIMAGNDFIGHQPDHISWSADNVHFYFSWGKDDQDKAKWFVYDIRTTDLHQLTPNQINDFPKRGAISDRNKKYFYSKNGAQVLKYENQKFTVIFSYHQRYSLNKVMPDGSLILSISNQIIEFNPNKGTFIQLVKPITPESQASKGFLENQQQELFNVIQDRNKDNDQDESDAVAKIEVKNNLSWFEINDQKTYLLLEDSDYPKNENTLYASYVTEDGFTKLKQARSKVGRKDPTHELNLFNLKTEKKILIDVSELSGIKDQPDYFKYYPESTKTDEIKNVIYHNHGTNAQGNQFLVEIKSYDNKDRWICVVDTSGNLLEVDHQRDTAWIGGPGISGWTSVGGNVGWIDHKTIYFQSEETGYSHLYAYHLDKKKKTQLTEGEFEIHDAKLSNDKQTFFVTANKTHPGNREFYHFEIKSKKWIPVLIADGNHEVEVSPDEKSLAIRYSYKNQPWEIYLADNKPNAEKEKITHSASKSFEAYPWHAPEVVTFEASDGEKIYARLYSPNQEKTHGAAVIFVHGAGYLQNAHNWWSGYYREFMFHNLLRDRGYTVLDIDYRASKGYGRDYRTAIYRHMGGKDLSDQLDGRRYLIDKWGIDSTRIGIYGGSYGGFITLMALLTEPGKFKCGAALRSVTDWAHYNHPYTSNILNTPETDPRAFKVSSPIYFAENLQDHLLLLHGMEDDNVQYQDVVRLSQRFIELGKKNWDLIGYPVEPHGFKETSSWTDEYRRILELFEKNLVD
ncbi:MAG: S9 family peptidase [Crocinitomicaceae bacterium]|nr:S9 family peptidase [Crocinitomicaceae bacterium]